MFYNRKLANLFHKHQWTHSFPESIYFFHEMNFLGMKEYAVFANTVIKRNIQKN